MFEPRLTIPEKSNKFYIAKADGGLNPCIPKPSGSPLRFANCVFYAPDNADSFDLSGYDYVVDAVDFVPAKLELAVRCEKLGVAHISAMGAGNKLHPELLEIADIYKTSVCPLARVMRRELKKRGVKKLLCVYSKEQPREGAVDEQGKRCPASNSFVPSTAGLIIASCVVNCLTGN